MIVRIYSKIRVKLYWISIVLYNIYAFFTDWRRTARNYVLQKILVIFCFLRTVRRTARSIVLQKIFFFFFKVYF